MKLKYLKRVILFVIVLVLGLSIGCSKSSGSTNNKNKNKQNQYLLAEEEASFNFFWETQNTNETSPGCGLIPDRNPSNGLASIASVGFGLASFVVGAENEYITKEEGYERCLMTLTKLRDLKREHGFFYHFYYEKLGSVADGSEVSNIDTSIFLCGALLAGEYFKGEVETLANAIYDEVEWTWFINTKNSNFYMAYNGTTGKFSGEWDTYAEHLMMFFLGAGSRTYPINKNTYDNMVKRVGRYGDYEFIYSWYGSIFTYQFSHAFIDFRYMTDDKGVNWFNNSVKATLADYQYCVDNPKGFVGFGEEQWGITACDTPTGYSGLLGTPPAGNNGTTIKNDGTVAPCGAIGSIVFAPDKVLPCIMNYATMFDGALIGDYGFYDAFNFEDRKPWIARSVIGIDKGITVLMIENYRSELIWDTFMKLEFMDRAIERLGFIKTA